ncbi:hypothetical protein PN498_17190 [Oscillatoria sp. CS-180]|nr:hypothetical protein [Oscillatoria sp. CS-180]MDB9527733.1 hypothetical protein [Oscillatoria sp. CS-180]
MMNLLQLSSGLQPSLMPLGQDGAPSVRQAFGYCLVHCLDG